MNGVCRFPSLFILQKNQSQYQWWKIPTKRKIKPKRKKNHCIKLINTFCHYYPKKKILIIEWKVQSYIKKLTSSRESTGVGKKNWKIIKEKTNSSFFFFFFSDMGSVVCLCVLILIQTIYKNIKLN